MYFNANSVDKKERKRLVLTGFRGVDAASPVYKVDSYRASGMVNFISKNGHNHKRPGWRQIGLFKGEIINGFFKFTIAHQEIRMVYTYSPTSGYGKFYFYNNGEYSQITTASGSPITSNIDYSRLKNRPAYMFIDNDRAYFIGMGDFLVLGVFEGTAGTSPHTYSVSELQLRRVYNDDSTYIPLTTTNIPPNETDYYESGDAVEYGGRKTFRDVNILTYRRRNELIGSDFHLNTDDENTPATPPVTRTYKLDGENLVSGIFKGKARHYVADEEDDDYGKTKEFNLKHGNAENLGTKTTRNLIASDIGTTLKSKTLYYDTSVSSVKTLGTKGTLDLGGGITEQVIYLLKAHDFIIYAVPVNALTDSEFNTLKLYRSFDGGSVSAEIGSASRLNPNEDYKVFWASGVSSLSITPDSSALESYGNIGKNGLNFTFSDFDARRYIIENTNGTDAGTRTYTVDEKTWGVIDFDKGEIELQVHPHTIGGEANIEIEFAEDNGDYAERILDCQIATLFGASGNANSLFVAGEEKFPNVDYWSDPVDYTYFPSANYCAIGTSNSKIMGYQRLGDTSLAILKEDCHGSEPTLYIRTGIATTIDTETVNGVESEIVKEGYYLTSGKYITQGAISRGGVGMLNGDALFLSRYGVYGIQINSDSIAVEQRVAKERSRLINPLLMKHADLSLATSIVYKDKFYIAVDNSVYIADARFIFSQKGDMADTYNYDWWVWDNCPIRRFFIIDDELCFGTEDGRICVFDDLFIDRHYDALASSASYDIANNRVQVSATDAGTIKSGDLIFFKGDLYRELFAKTDLSIDYTTYRITVGHDKALPLYTGMEVFLDNIDNATTDLAVNKTYLISDINLSDGSFKLTKKNGSSFTFSGKFRIAVKLNNEIMKIKETEFDGGSYLKFCNRYDKDEKVYTLITYNSTTPTAIPYLYYEKNVVAKWITPVMDMGANDYIKTLTRFTLAAEQIKDGKISLGFETKNLSGMKEIDAEGLNVFDFSNLDFGNFTFDTGFESSFTKAMKASFNFIVFKFESDNPCDCCVHSLTIEYKVNHLNKGVW